MFDGAYQPRAETLYGTTLGIISAVLNLEHNRIYEDPGERFLTVLYYKRPIHRLDWMLTNARRSTDSFANFYFYRPYDLDITIISLIGVSKYHLCSILEGCPCINAIMGRPTWGNLPLDPRKHQEHINKILQSSESVRIRQLIGSSTQARDLQLRTQTAMVDIELSSWISKFAVATQKYGRLTCSVGCVNEVKDHFNSVSGCQAKNMTDVVIAFICARLVVLQAVRVVDS